MPFKFQQNCCTIFNFQFAWVYTWTASILLCFTLCVCVCICIFTAHQTQWVSSNWPSVARVVRQPHTLHNTSTWSDLSSLMSGGSPPLLTMAALFSPIHNILIVQYSKHTPYRGHRGPSCLVPMMQPSELHYPVKWGDGLRAQGWLR